LRACFILSGLHALRMSEVNAGSTIRAMQHMFDGGAVNWKRFDGPHCR